MPDDNGAQVKPAAVIVIALMPDHTLNLNHPPNEMVCRFMLDKARAVLDDVFRPRPDAPRVALALPETLKHLRS